MSATKDFHIGDILSITDGRLVSPRHIEGVYDILGWMTGENLFTHQLPRVAREAAPALLAMHPQLSSVSRDDAVDGTNMDEWLADKVARFGEFLPVPKLGADQHERIDAMSELVGMVHPDKIIPVQL
jgi:hypothetical protein